MREDQVVKMYGFLGISQQGRRGDRAIPCWGEVFEFVEFQVADVAGQMLDPLEAVVASLLGR